MVHPRLVKGFNAIARRLEFRGVVVNACGENVFVAG
jgi:hypothetical protein